MSGQEPSPLNRSIPRLLVGAILAAGFSAWSQALPKVEDAWVRSAVAGQQGTGAFMKLTASQATQLVSVASPLAGVVQVHEMKIEGEVMKMRAVGKLDLPAGRTVELKPGGYHIMLLDLKRALQPGSSVPMTLSFRDAKGVEGKLELNVPVAVKAPGASAAAPMQHKSHGHKP